MAGTSSKAGGGKSAAVAHLSGRATSAMDAIIKRDRPLPPANSRTIADYLAANPGTHPTTAEHRMKRLAIEHGWKTGKFSGTRYWWT